MRANQKTADALQISPGSLDCESSLDHGGARAVLVIGSGYTNESERESSSCQAAAFSYKRTTGVVGGGNGRVASGLKLRGISI